MRDRTLSRVHLAIPRVGGGKGWVYRCFGKHGCARERLSKSGQDYGVGVIWSSSLTSKHSDNRPYLPCQAHEPAISWHLAHSHDSGQIILAT